MTGKPRAIGYGRFSDESKAPPQRLTKGET
jgi:hypothetical protein